MFTVFVLSLIAAFAAGALLRPRQALLVVALVMVGRYALAVANWGWGGPDDEATVSYLVEAFVLIGVPTLACTALGALTAAVPRRLTARQPGH